MINTFLSFVVVVGTFWAVARLVVHAFKKKWVLDKLNNKN